ncbi:MAG: substrate-binding domain-containing protein [Gaiellaceae bacterium]
MRARAVVILAAAIAVGVAFATSEGNGSAPNGSSGAPIVLEFPYSTDTEDLLEPLIEDFNAEGFRHEGREIVVEGEGIASGVAETAIAEGRLKPVIWGPPSSLWGRLLNHHVGESWVADENPSLLRSPQVIAMWEPHARALGWPDAPIGWTDLLSLATDPDGWATRGRPQYGAFKLGHTNPNSSTSGLSAVAAMYYAVAGGFTAEEIAGPGVREAVRDIERSIVHYGYTADDFLDQMARYGPGYAHAVAVQETSLVQFNEENESVKLVAVYPSEGTFVADYPFIVLRAPWVDDAERAAADVFQRWLLARITPELAASDAYRAPGAHRTLSPVDAEHGADPAQPEAELQLPPPEVIATIQADWNEDRKPANVALVVDTSGSLSQDGLLQRQQEALEAFLDELRPEDRVAMVTFGTEVFEPVPIAPLGEDEAMLRQTIRDLIPSGQSALYDAVRAGFSGVRRLEDQTRINAVVVLTDGGDDSSSNTLDDLAEELGDACDVEGVVIPVVTVAYGQEADEQALERIAAACQGRALEATPEDVVELFRRIALLF